MKNTITFTLTAILALSDTQQVARAAPTVRVAGTPTTGVQIFAASSAEGDPITAKAPQFSSVPSAPAPIKKRHYVRTVVIVLGACFAFALFAAVASK